MDKNKKNNLALFFGLFLILLVAAITFIRPGLEKEEVPPEADRENSKEEGLDFGMSPKELSEKKENSRSITIADVRGRTFFDKEHILDAKNMAPQDLEKYIKDARPGSILVFVDDDGNEAKEIAKKVRNDGFDESYYLEGGLNAWKREYNPTILDGDPYSFTDQSKVTYIKSDDLHKDLENKDLFIADLRKNGDFEVGHIKGAVNIPLQDLEKRREEIPAGKKIVLCDEDGLWAFKGAVRLFDMGIFNVFALSDGLKGWREKQFELVNREN